MQHTFPVVKETFKKRLTGPLPGLSAQLKMAPAGREGLDIEQLDKANVKHAAVLALFTEIEQEAHLVLTKRVSYPGVHSGQMSFPGGKKEQQDENYMQTALRETEEEIGVHANNVEVAGELSPLYIPPSNFYVQPFIGFLNNHQSFKAQELEVEKIHLIPFYEVLQAENQSFQDFNRNGQIVQVPVFKLDNQIVWGATAMMISELKSLYLG
jgi:8-oxo-dGTP pyrophosphatase MutT (NUDIX family)